MPSTQNFNKLEGLRPHHLLRLQRSAKPSRIASLAPSWTKTPKIAPMFKFKISIGWASKLIMKILQHKKTKWEKPAISNNKLMTKDLPANLTRRAWDSYCPCPNSNWGASSKAKLNQICCRKSLLPHGRQQRRVARFLNRLERRPSRSPVRKAEITARPNRKNKNQLETGRKMLSKMEFKCSRCPREAKWNIERKRTIKSWILKRICPQ